MSRWRTALVAAVVVVLTIGGDAGDAAASDQFADVPDGHPFHDEIGWMATLDIAGGFDDGTFRPAAPVTRQSMAAFLHRLWSVLGEDEPSPVPDPGFTDVPPTHVFFEDIAWMAEVGITGGFEDGSFRPASAVTRQSMAAFLHRLWGAADHADPDPIDDPEFTDVPSSHVFFEDIAWMAEVGITGGFDDGSFRPASAVTRQSMAVFLHRLWGQEGFVVDVPTDTHDAAPGDGRCMDGNGDCSLRAAIDEANALPAADSVVIAPGVDPMITITGDSDDENAVGDLDVTDDLTIDGQGATVDADDIDRVFDLKASRLSLTDMTITDGTGQSGGAILVEEGDLTLDRVDVTASRGLGGSSGGGIYQWGGTLSIVDSTISGNSTTGDAGGIGLWQSTTTIAGSTIIGNTSGHDGGGIQQSGGALSIVDSTIAGNSSGDEGAGIRSGGGALSITGSDVEDNTVSGASPNGGGLMVSGSVTITGSTVTGNAALGSDAGGGGLTIAGGSTTLVDTEVGGNLASGPSARGGGIQITAGSLTTRASSLHSNQATGTDAEGGGLYVAAAASASIRNVTVDSNGATGDGGGVFARGSITITAATITANTALEGSAVHRVSGTTTILGSIVGGAGADCVGTVVSAGFNADSDGTCGFDDAEDLPSSSPYLLPLDEYGGPTPSRLAYSNAPSVGAIPNGTAGLCDASATTDQRGRPRPIGSACDVGAVEGSSGFPATPRALTVDSALDAPDQVPGDGTCDTGAGICTLRAAIDETNAYPTGDSILMAAGIDPILTRVGAAEDDNRTGDLDVADHVSIDGQGATVDANDLDRVLHLRETSVALIDVVITDGNATQGGGIYLAPGEATMTGATIEANTAADDGGGIYQLTGSLTIVDSTIASNAAGDEGGGVWSSGALHVTGSSIGGNTATGGSPNGGGLMVNGTVDIVGSRMNGNQAVGSGTVAGGGGITVAGGSASFADTEVSGNLASATLAQGGGIQVAAGTATVNRTLLHDNTAVGSNQYEEGADGGGLYVAGGASATVRNTTVDANEASDDGGGVAAVGSTSIRSSTLTGNAAWDGSALNTGSEATTVAGSVLSGPGADCVGTVVSSGFNLDSDGSCWLADPDDLAPSSPYLAPLADNGGPTPSRLPAANSPIVDAIPAGTPGLCDGTVPVDQRGQPRPAGAACEIGAVEGHSTVVIPSSTFIVDAAVDGPDVAPGDGTCDTGAGICTLRAAIGETNALPGADTVVIAAAVHPSLTLAGADEDANATGDLDVTDHLTIEGGGSTVDADDLDRVLQLHDGTLVLTEMTMTGGFEALDGGGIHGLGTMTITDSHIDQNVALFSGGGIYLEAGRLNLTGSTVDGNLGVFGGGAFYQETGHSRIATTSLSLNQGLSSGERGGGILLDAGALAVSDSVVAGNTTHGNGGGIHNEQGTLVLHRTVVRDNTASSGNGGGISTETGVTQVDESTISGNRTLCCSLSGGGLYVGLGSLAVTGSTIEMNFATSGGGIYRGGGPSLSVTNTTITRNRAASYGGGVVARSQTELTNVTIADNEAPSGTALGGGGLGVVVRGSIVSGAAPACSGLVASSGYNLGSATCGLDHPTDLVDVEALLHAPADNGGPTRTMLPFANSPAVDAVPLGAPDLCDGSVPTDQRAVARPQDGSCDIGAVEGHSPDAPSPLSLIVDTAVDDGDLDLADGVCDIGDGTCSLRAAIDQTNAWPSADVITVAPGVDPELTITGRGDEQNLTGDLDVTDDLTIHGGGSTLDGDGDDRVLHHRAGNLAIEGLIVTGGSSRSNGLGSYVQDGAGIRHDAGAMTITDSRIADNSAWAGGVGLYVGGGDVEVVRTVLENNTTTSGGDYGGGIHQSGGTLTITDSSVVANRARYGAGIGHTGGVLTLSGVTIAGNSTPGEGTGGGISHTGGTLDVLNSTLTGNVATERGGGIWATQDFMLRYSTVVDNSSPLGAAIMQYADDATVSASILSASGGACSGSILSGGHNLASDTSCGLVQPSDQPAAFALLAPLADNGGPTATRLAFANSPTVDAIPAGAAGLCDGTIAFDQRGVLRPQGAACDIGAVEGHTGTTGP